MSTDNKTQAVEVEKDNTKYLILCEVSGIKNGEGYRNMVNLFACDEAEAFIKMLTAKDAFAKNNEDVKIIGVYSKTGLKVVEQK